MRAASPLQPHGGRRSRCTERLGWRRAGALRTCCARPSAHDAQAYARRLRGVAVLEAHKLGLEVLYSLQHLAPFLLFRVLPLDDRPSLLERQVTWHVHSAPRSARLQAPSHRRAPVTPGPGAYTPKVDHRGFGGTGIS